MNRTAVIYSFNSKKSAKIAQKVVEEFNDEQVVPVNVENITSEEFSSYDQLILGVPTWFDGELPNYWDEFVPELEDMDLKGKKIALFGLGDQAGYPENFLDGLGIMAEILENRGATLVGFTSTEGYNFESSRAVRGKQFAGLGIDYENQGSMNKERVSRWVTELKTAFG